MEEDKKWSACLRMYQMHPKGYIPKYPASQARALLEKKIPGASPRTLKTSALTYLEPNRTIRLVHTRVKCQFMNF